jgi:hypothetical protein
MLQESQLWGLEGPQFWMRTSIMSQLEVTNLVLVEVIAYSSKRARYQSRQHQVVDRLQLTLSPNTIAMTL